jgi:hypothetical protein
MGRVERLLKFLAAGGHSCVGMSSIITPTVTRFLAKFPARITGEPNSFRSYGLVTLTMDRSGTYFSSDKNIQRHLDETCTPQDSE